MCYIMLMRELPSLCHAIVCVSHAYVMLLCVSPMLMSMSCLSSDAYVMLDVVLKDADAPSSGAVSKSSMFASHSVTQQSHPAYHHQWSQRASCLPCRWQNDRADDTCNSTAQRQQPAGQPVFLCCCGGCSLHGGGHPADPDCYGHGHGDHRQPAAHCAPHAHRLCCQGMPWLQRGCCCQRLIPSADCRVAAYTTAGLQLAELQGCISNRTLKQTVLARLLYAVAPTPRQPAVFHVCCDLTFSKLPAVIVGPALKEVTATCTLHTWNASHAEASPSLLVSAGGC